MENDDGSSFWMGNRIWRSQTTRLLTAKLPFAGATIECAGERSSTATGPTAVGMDPGRASAALVVWRWLKMVVPEGLLVYIVFFFQTDNKNDKT